MTSAEPVPDRFVANDLRLMVTLLRSGPPGRWVNIPYHDTEWGVPVHDDRTHFEFLVLEGAQAGLSWLHHPRSGETATGAPSPNSIPSRWPASRPNGWRRSCSTPRSSAIGPRWNRPCATARAFLAIQKEFGIVRRLCVGLRRRPARWSTSGAAPEQLPEADFTAGVREAEQPTYGAAGLPVRRAPRSAIPTSRRRGWSTTTWSVASATPSSQGPAHEDAGADAGHDGVLRRPAPARCAPVVDQAVDLDEPGGGVERAVPGHVARRWPGGDVVGVAAGGGPFDRPARSRARPRCPRRPWSGWTESCSRWAPLAQRRRCRTGTADAADHRPPAPPGPRRGSSGRCPGPAASRSAKRARACSAAAEGAWCQLAAPRSGVSDVTGTART